MIDVVVGQGDEIGDLDLIAEHVEREDLVARGRLLPGHGPVAGPDEPTRSLALDLPASPQPDTIGDETGEFAGNGPSATLLYEPTTLDALVPSPGRKLDPTGGLVGRTFDDFEILEELGHGGMGTVYRARQVGLDREVALKTLHRSRMAGDHDLERFRDEALAIATLNHPNIVPIYAVGQVDGVSYYSMPLAEGGTLESRVQAGPISCREAVRWLLPIAEAVEHAHRLGIIHRDLKPSNILVDAEGRPLVADFGLALRIVTDSGEASSSVMAGTPNYMAPEQADAAVLRLTTAVDVYGLGAILYAMLSGKPPFQGSSAAEVVRSVRGEAPRSLRPRVSGLDLDLEAICLMCLQKDPRRRYPSALALVDDLNRYVDRRPVAARPLARAESVARWVRRQPLIAALVLTIVLVVLGGGVLVTRAWLEADRQALQYQREAYVATIRLVGQEYEHNNWGRARELFEAPIIRDSRLTGHDRPGFERDYLGRLLGARVDSRELPGGQVTAIDYDPGGKRLAVAATDRVRVYDEEKPGQFLDFSAQSAINDLDFSPDGRSIAIVDKLGTLRLIDPRTGALLRFRETDGTRLARVAWSRDGKRLATLNGFGVVRAWEAEGVAASRVLAMPIPNAVAIGFAQDDRLAVGCTDGKVRVYDLGKDGEPLVFEGQSTPIRSVAFDATGTLLASADEDGVILIREAASGRPERRCDGMSGAIYAMKFSPDGRKLAAAGADQVVWLHDLKSSDPPRKFGGHVTSIVDLDFRPDGERLAACADGTVKVWDLGDNPGMLTTPGENRSALTAVAVDPGGRWLASAGFDGRALIWDRVALRPVRTIDLRATEKPFESLTALSFADGDRLALGCASGLILLVEPETGRVVGRFPGHEKGIRAIGFDPRGGRFASASDDGTVRLWDLATGRATIVVRRPNPIWSLAFDPNGGRLAFSEAHNGNNDDYPVRIWDLAAGRQEALLRGHVNAVASLTYNGDGTRLASASFDGTIRVWDVASRRLAFAPLSGHNGCVVDVAFTPDGDRLASAGYDHTIRIWAMNQGQNLLVLRGHTREVTGLDYTRDGRHLVSVGYDGQVRIW